MISGERVTAYICELDMPNQTGLEGCSLSTLKACKYLKYSEKTYVMEPTAKP